MLNPLTVKYGSCGARGLASERVLPHNSHASHITHRCYLDGTTSPGCGSGNCGANIGSRFSPRRVWCVVRGLPYRCNHKIVHPQTHSKQRTPGSPVILHCCYVAFVSQPAGFNTCTTVVCRYSSVRKSNSPFLLQLLSRKKP